jgi:hypothetical protein
VPISRRAILLSACLIVIAWAGPVYAKPISFKVELTGAQEVPAVAGTAAGMADITYDPATREVTWSITYSGLSGSATMAHFHGPAMEGKNGPVAIWLTRKSPVDNPIRGEATLTAEQAEQFAVGEWYINVHTRAHPEGEIRGQVAPPKS